MGKIFPSESPVARFLVRACIIRNDLVLAQEATGREYAREDEHRPGVPIYHLFVASAHYREAAKVIHEELEHPAVAKFVESLSPQTQQRLKRLTQSFTPWPGSFVETRLKPLRDTVFHYPTAEDVERALREIRESETGIDFRGGTYLDTRYTFADDVLMGITQEHIGADEAEIEATLTELATLIQEYVYFVHEAVTTYLDRFNEGLFRVDTY